MGSQWLCQDPCWLWGRALFPCTLSLLTHCLASPHALSLGIKWLFALCSQCLCPNGLGDSWQGWTPCFSKPEKVKCREVRCFLLVLRQWGWLPCGTGRTLGGLAEEPPVPTGQSEEEAQGQPCPSILPCGACVGFLPCPTCCWISVPPTGERPCLSRHSASLLDGLCPVLHCSCAPNLTPGLVTIYKVLSLTVPRLGSLAVSLKKHTKTSSFHHSK